jgi:hypothetical protein
MEKLRTEMRQKKFTLEEVLEELKKVKNVCPGKHGGKKK